MQAAQRVFAGELAHPAAAVTADGAALRTPSGARCERLFLVGACTEIREAPGRIEARIADPTGTFVVAASFDQHAVVERLRGTTTPAFLAVTCTVAVRGGSPPQVSLVAESVAPATRRLRDLWVMVAAEHTLDRLEKHPPPASPECIDELAAMVRSALETVPDAMEPAVLADPRLVVMDILAAGSGPRGMAVEALVESGQEQGLSEEGIRRIIDDLRAEGDCYAPATGYVKLL